MNWASTVILSSAILGVVNVNDSYLLSKRLPGLRTFLMPSGVIHLLFALILLYLFPLSEDITAWAMLAVVASGITRTVGVVILLYNLKREDVSRVIPIVHTSPVFVAIIAVPLLGETLYYLQWLAIVIVVAGAVMVSAEKNPLGSTSQMGRPFLLLFMASLLFAVADITRKYALFYMSFWNGFSLTTICMAIGFILIAARPHVFRQLKDMKQRNSSLALLTLGETLAVIGIVLSFLAMKGGPVSLVATILGSRPVFVAIFSLVLSYFFPRLLRMSATKKIMALRMAATAMIVGGVSIIYLT